MVNLDIRGPGHPALMQLATTLSWLTKNINFATKKSRIVETMRDPYKKWLVVKSCPNRSDGVLDESSLRIKILRKEVIQPQVPLRLPCYDFTPVADLTVADCLLAVSASSSGKTNSHGVTGGVYKARERIHRGVLIRDY